MNDRAMIDELLRALGRVVEPCSVLTGKPISILAMGLLENLSYDAGHVNVVLCLTDPGCVHFRAMREYITDELRRLPGVNTVDVSLTTEKVWTPDRARVH
jgi:metal-sulfur cluster biosynthetic enzyme